MHRWIIGACVFYMSAVVIYYGFFHTDFSSKELNTYFNSNNQYSIEVISYPNKNDYRITFTARIHESHSKKLSEYILVRTSPEYSIRYGDVFHIEGVIKQPESFVGDTGRTFNYPAYLATQNIYGIIEPRSLVFIKNEGAGVISQLFLLRNWFVATLGNYFTQDELGLIAGMLIGEQSLISKNLTEDFRIVGLSHIVVLSGYNITLVAQGMMAIVSIIGFGYRSRRLVALIVVPLFVIMTGLGMSSLRAGIMSVIGLLLQIDTRVGNPLHIIVYTLTCIVVVSPSSLLYSPSLHLSFLALIGLVYGTPIVKSFSWLQEFLDWSESNTILRALVLLVIETMTVQMFVLPYILFMSGTFSFLSLLVNLIVVPVVPVIMLGGMVVVTTSLVSSLGAELTAFVVQQLLGYVITVSSIIAKISWAQVELHSINASVMIILYLLVGLLLLWCSGTHSDLVSNK